MRRRFRSADRLLSSLRRFHAAFCQSFPALERGGGLRNPQCAVAFRSTSTDFLPDVPVPGGFGPLAVYGLGRTLSGASIIILTIAIPSGGDMRRRNFIWLLLTVLAISLHWAGTAHAQYRYWYPYRSWSNDYPFRQQYQRGYKKSESTRKAKPEKASKDTSKDASKEIAKGPLLIIISIADQRISLYDDGALVARSSVSTGVKGHPTPLGVFSVISKNKWHRSNIYSGAPMPYMQRITWSGIALHAGDLPGYPASHGCIRLTHDFAVRLWHLTKRGTRVIIALEDVRPVEIASRQLFVPKPRVASASPDSGTPTHSGNDSVATATTHTPRMSSTDDGAKAADPASTGVRAPKVAPISVFVSRQLSKLFVRRISTPLFDVPIKIRNPAEPM